MLKLENIVLTINKGTPLERSLFGGLNLILGKSEFVTLIGSNGTGKSTLFNIIAGDVKPDQGKVLFEKRDVTQTPSYRNAKEIARVVQDPKAGTIEQMTLEENLSFALMRGFSRKLKLYRSYERKKCFYEKLSLLGMGLENRLNDLVAHLSGGQRQALSLIMALLSDAKILLLDEITAALDPKSAEQVMRVTHKVVTQTGLSAIMITHNMSDAIRYGNRLVILGRGKILKEYSSQEKTNLNPQILFDDLNLCT